MTCPGRASSQWLGEAKVWRALLPKLPMTALLRNLARMTASGALRTSGVETAKVERRLGDGKALHGAHPPDRRAVGAHDLCTARVSAVRSMRPSDPTGAGCAGEGFLPGFRQRRSRGKRVVLALDVSGSMSTGEVAGAPGLTPCVAATAMALVTAAVEPQATIVGFSDALIPLQSGAGSRSKRQSG